MRQFVLSLDTLCVRKLSMAGEELELPPKGLDLQPPSQLHRHQQIPVSKRDAGASAFV